VVRVPRLFFGRGFVSAVAAAQDGQIGRKGKDKNRSGKETTGVRETVRTSRFRGGSRTSLRFGQDRRVIMIETKTGPRHRTEQKQKQNKTNQK
jgi:hypothetical protein